MNESKLRSLIKDEVARLKDGYLLPGQIEDDEPLFSIPGEAESRIDLDSLDALELSFAIEQATGAEQPQELDYHELLTVDAIVSFLNHAVLDVEPSRDLALEQAIPRSPAN